MAGERRWQDEDVPLQLAHDEPEAGPWRVELLSTMIDVLVGRRLGRTVPSRPAILAVDGRSNNGKTTLAVRISQAVPAAIVVHTDDIAWRHSRFGWADLLVDGILVPVHQGRAVRYRPPRWVEHGRPGAIEVPAGCPLLIVEGDGAGRREVAHLLDALIWVQSDEREAEKRRLSRDAHPSAIDLVNLPSDGSAGDDHGWMTEEVPFNASQRTWERADIIVCGTPEFTYDPRAEVVVAPPPLPLDR